MNRLLNTSSITGSTCVPMARRCLARLHALEQQVVERRHARLPAGLDDGGRVALGDDRRAGRSRGRAAPARARTSAASCQRPPLNSAHRLGHRRSACGQRVVPRLGRRVARADGLDRHRLDHQRALLHQEGEALPVGGLERGLDLAARRRRARRAPSRCPRSADARAGARAAAPRSRPGAAARPRPDAASRSSVAVDLGHARRPAAARSPPRASRSGRPGPCRRPTARRRAGARRRGSCRARRPPGRRAGRRRRRSTAACSASRRSRARPRSS